MKTVALVKQEHIIEAAVKRFTHFGIHKTTMAEIAGDLGISKPALFYYFQDKTSLQEAVGKKIINEFIVSFKESLGTANTIEDGLMCLLEVKRAYLKKYLRLAIQVQHNDGGKLLSKEMAKEVDDQVTLLLADFLQHSVDKGDLNPLDTQRNSRLILDTLLAFDQCFSRKSDFMTENDIDALLDKQSAVVKLLVNGLNHNEWKN